MQWGGGPTLSSTASPSAEKEDVGLHTGVPGGHATRVHGASDAPSRSRGPAASVSSCPRRGARCPRRRRPPSPASGGEDPGRRVCSAKQEAGLGAQCARAGQRLRVRRARPSLRGPASRVCERRGACGGSGSRAPARPRGSVRAVIWARTRPAARPRRGRAAPCPPSGCSRRSAPSSRA